MTTADADLLAPAEPSQLDLAWDGHRVVASAVDGVVRLFSEDLRDCTALLRPAADALALVDARDFVLDGFVCVLDAQGRPSFEQLRAWVGGARGGPLVYVAWDALRVSGEDLRGLSLPERRARLRSLLPARDGALVCSEPLEGDLTAVREAMARAGLPGVVARAVRSGGPWVAHGATRETPVALGRALAAPPVVTNRDKVLYPRDGLTKQQVVDYYADVAPVLLAAMRERPVVCQRWPDGIDDFTWFQHRVPPRAPDYVRSVLIEGNRRVLLGNREALLWFANQAALTFHGWAGRVGSLKAPDWAVLDLDPGEATSWAQVIEVALALRRLLELLEVDSVVKTSGQKGLHVLVPLAPGHSNAQAHEFAALVAGVLHRLLPDVVALEAGKARRRGRLFLDHLQNYPGKTLVLPYSLRAVDGACVSAPLGWSEVTPALVPSAFSLRTMRARLDAKGDLFAPALKGRVQLAPVLAKLKG